MVWNPIDAATDLGETAYETTTDYGETAYEITTDYGETAYETTTDYGETAYETTTDYGADVEETGWDILTYTAPREIYTKPRDAVLGAGSTVIDYSIPFYTTDDGVSLPSLPSLGLPGGGSEEPNNEQPAAGPGPKVIASVGIVAFSLLIAVIR